MEENKIKKTGMARLLEIAFTKKGLVIPAVTLSAISSVASFIPYLAIFEIVKLVLAGMHDVTSIDAAAIIRYGWIAFGGVALYMILYFAALMCSHLAAFGTLYELKVNFASHLAKLPLGIHVVVGSGKLRKIMDENIEKIEEFIAHQLPDIVASFVAPIVMIVILMTVDWRLGLAALVGVMTAFILQTSMYGEEGAKEKMRQYQEHVEDMNNAAVEYVRGITVVKAFKQTVYSFKRLRDTIDNYTKMIIEYTLSWEKSFSLFATLINNIYLFVTPVAIILMMIFGVTEDFVSKFIFYLLFVPAIASILMKVMYVNSNSMRIINGIEAMDEILNKPEISSPKNPKQISNHDIKFDDVVFCYEGAEDKRALDGISFEAKEGEVTAIVGPSGGGKTTIAHLIPRFFDVTDGAISIGNVNITNMNVSYLMDKVSFVFQDVFLFKQSIIDNIRIGRDTASKEEVIRAAKAAQAHEFIMSLPEGYETVIGTKGVHLSGGEKQRIAIARALLKDAPIVVLDEATAFSDPENEYLIQKAFKELMKNKTVVMIAHRLSTIKSADKIIVINEGKVVEEGKHDALLERKGKYAEMWNIYTKTISWKFDKKGVNV